MEKEKRELIQRKKRTKIRKKGTKKER